MGSNLVNTDLTGVILTAATLDGADFSQAILQRAKLDQIRASGVTFVNTDFSAANLMLMELSDSIATGALFYEANMNGMQARIPPPFPQGRAHKRNTPRSAGLARRLRR